MNVYARIYPPLVFHHSNAVFSNQITDLRLSLITVKVREILSSALRGAASFRKKCSPLSPTHIITIIIHCTPVCTYGMYPMNQMPINALSFL